MCVKEQLQIPAEQKISLNTSGVLSYQPTQSGRWSAIRTAKRGSKVLNQAISSSASPTIVAVSGIAVRAGSG
jgi:enoyl-CoA hydratase/carnithine racemase